jgi:hypothetical protein
MFIYQTKKQFSYRCIIFERIVGGSSGGEGCIVSSAGSIMGIGSDIGGSIRMVIKKMFYFLKFID